MGQTIVCWDVVQAWGELKPGQMIQRRLFLKNMCRTLYLNGLITLSPLPLALSEQCGLHDAQMLWTDFLTSLYFIPKDKVSAVLLKKYFQSKIHYLISANYFQNI